MYAWDDEHPKEPASIWEPVGVFLLDENIKGTDEELVMKTRQLLNEVSLPNKARKPVKGDLIIIDGRSYQLDIEPKKVYPLYVGGMFYIASIPDQDTPKNQVQNEISSTL